MAIWPDIVRELTEEDNKELPDVNKWITEVSISFKIYISLNNTISNHV